MSGHVSSPGTSSNAAPVLEKQVIMAWTGIVLEADGPDPCGLARLGSQNRRELGPRDALCCPPPSPRRRAEICLWAVGPCGLSRAGFSSGRWRHHRLPCSDSRNFHLKSHCPASFDSYLCLFPGVMRNLQTAACTPRPPQTTRVAPRRKAETWARILFPPARPTRPSPASPSHTCAFPRGDGSSSALLSRPPLPLPVRVSLCSRVCRHPSASACSPSLCVCVHMRVCARTCVCVRVHACCSISAPDERAVVSGFSASEASSWQAAVSPA
uniref:Uncharacterized protein n=1 Tax=Rousettus aegyptiacus TaxID=9407 RepID=A0A7J8DY91_ROUAE|nr:hypothetical protein HJG63_008459 [Rousettus aegyptiacus]